MTLSPGAKVQPKRSTWRLPAGFSAACSSILSERAPTPPRFIGHSTWMSRMGLRPKRRGMRVFTRSDDPRHGDIGLIRLHEIEIAVALRLPQVGQETLIDTVSADDDLAPCGLAEHLGQTHHR